MLFPKPPPILADHITYPQVRCADVWSPLLIEVIAQTEMHYPAFLAAPKSSAAWVISSASLEAIEVLDQQKRSWGQFLAMALVREDTRAAQAILVASSLSIDSIISGLTTELSACGRLDLWHPGIELIYDFCCSLWKNDEPFRTHGAVGLNSSVLPEPSDFSVEEQEDILDSSGSYDVRGLRLWWEIGSQISILLNCKSATDISDMGDAFSVVVDGFQCMPSLRPFAALCLRAIGQSLSGSALVRPYLRQPWLVSMDWDKVNVLIEKTTDIEATMVLRNFADEFVVLPKADNSFEQVHKLAQLIIASRPNLSMDDWIVLGTPSDFRLGQIGYKTWHGLRYKLLGLRPRHGQDHGSILDRCNDTWNALIKSNRISVVRIVTTYDQLAQWLGPDRGHEMSQNTLMSLGLLFRTSNNSFPFLRSAVDKGLLVHGDGLSGTVDQEACPKIDGSSLRRRL